MRYIEKIGEVEHIYEANTPEEIMDLYNKKNKQYSKVKFTLRKNGEVYKQDITLMELEKELEKSPLRDFIVII